MLDYRQQAAADAAESFTAASLLARSMHFFGGITPSITRYFTGNIASGIATPVLTEVPAGRLIGVKIVPTNNTLALAVAVDIMHGIPGIPASPITAYAASIPGGSNAPIILSGNELFNDGDTLDVRAVSGAGGTSVNIAITLVWAPT